MTQSASARLIESIRSGAAPTPIRAAAARGVLPLTPEDLFELQVLLAEDSEPQVREAATASLAQVKPDTVAALVAASGTSPETLIHLAASIPRWPESAPPLARRPDLPGAAARVLAKLEAAETIDALAANQRLLTEHEDLGALLLANPAMERASRNRLLDYLDELEKVRKREELDATLAEAAAAEEALAPANDPFLAALGVDAEVEALLPELGLELGQLADRSELLGDEEDDALYQRLARLNVGQKLRLAMFGTREERTLLVRDSNRIVASAVVKNPSFTEQEADMVSRSRNVNDEVLRLIGTHRDFAKSYQVQHNLVCNPRCPIGMAIRLVTRLHDRELKLLSKNRNVQEGVRRQAKKIVDAREARQRVRIGKAKR